MPLMHGNSNVAGNIKEMIRAGHKPKAAIAAALAQSRKKKMARGGVVELPEEANYGMMPEYEPLVEEAGQNPGGEDATYLEPEDNIRDLGRIQAEGKSRPDEVANPMEQDEARLFAHALRRHADAMLSQENPGGMPYAMGGLVQDGTPELERLDGTEPELGWVDDGTGEPMSSIPIKPDGLEHQPVGDPSGAGLSAEAREAIARKRKARRYGVYNPP